MGLQQSLRGTDGNAVEVGTLAHAPVHTHDRLMKTSFDHERLNVYQEAIIFCGWVGDLLNEIAAKAATKDQLDRASTSIPLNIAEGNGKFANADRARFLEIARGSALECAACIDVLGARKLICSERIIPAKERLVRIANMLVGMLKRFSEHARSLREEEGFVGSSKSMSRSTSE